MKGYNKKLNELLEYVFNKYKNDTVVAEFKPLFVAKQTEKQNRKQIIVQRPKVVKIGIQTAKICQTLVDGELIKNIYSECFSKKYVNQLEQAQKELIGDYDIELEAEKRQRLQNLIKVMKGE